jgi:hypothetical protein
MKGYPKHIATKQDFINLLAMPEYRKQAQADMQKVLSVADDKVRRTISIDEVTKAEVTELIDNPNPLYKQKGFETRKALSDMVAAEAAADVIEDEKPVDEGSVVEVQP